MLKAARARLATEDHWVQYTSTRALPSAEGGTILAYCAVGAVHQCITLEHITRPLLDFAQAEEMNVEKAIDFLDAAIPENFGGLRGYQYARRTVQYNDTEGRTYEEIIALYDRAIALAGEA